MSSLWSNATVSVTLHNNELVQGRPLHYLAHHIEDSGHVLSELPRHLFDSGSYYVIVEKDGPNTVSARSPTFHIIGSVPDSLIRSSPVQTSCGEVWLPPTGQLAGTFCDHFILAMTGHPTPSSSLGSSAMLMSLELKLAAVSGQLGYFATAGVALDSSSDVAVDAVTHGVFPPGFDEHRQPLPIGNLSLVFTNLIRTEASLAFTLLMEFVTPYGPLYCPIALGIRLRSPVPISVETNPAQTPPGDNINNR